MKVELGKLLSSDRCQNTGQGIRDPSEVLEMLCIFIWAVGTQIYDYKNLAVFIFEICAFTVCSSSIKNLFFFQ